MYLDTQRTLQNLKLLPDKLVKKVLRQAVKTVTASVKSEVKAISTGRDKKTIKSKVRAKKFKIFGQVYKLSVYASRNEYGALRYAGKPLEGGRRPTKLHGKMKNLLRKIRFKYEKLLIREIGYNFDQVYK